MRGFHCTAGFERMERQVGENEYLTPHLPEEAVVREVNSLVILELEEAVVRDSELGTRDWLVLEVVVLEEVVLAVLQEEVVSAVVIPHQVGVVRVVIHDWTPVMEQAEVWEVSCGRSTLLQFFHIRRS